MAFERDKVKGAVRTDFILSAEIVAITLGIVAEAPLLNQILILSGIALLVTVGVYGLVGVIVKLDDMGYWLVEKSSALAQWTGKALLAIAPRLMKVLSIVGTWRCSRSAAALWSTVSRRCTMPLKIWLRGRMASLPRCCQRLQIWCWDSLLAPSCWPW